MQPGFEHLELVERKPGGLADLDQTLEEFLPVGGVELLVEQLNDVRGGLLADEHERGEGGFQHVSFEVESEVELQEVFDDAPEPSDCLVLLVVRRYEGAVVDPDDFVLGQFVLCDHLGDVFLQQLVQFSERQVRFLGGPAELFRREGQEESAG